MPSVGSIMHRDRSYWFDAAPPYAPSEPVRGERPYDVCVIGGGVTGLSTAFHLRKLDPAVRVCVLEAEVVGYGASGRNAGQLIVQFGGGSYDDHIKTFGAENVGAAWRYVANGIRLMEALQAAEQIDCDYAATGYMKAALEVEGSASIERYMAFLERIGQAEHFQAMTAESLQEEFASPYLGPGIHDRRGGQFNPLKFVRGLAAAAKRLGADIFEHSPVAHIDLGVPQIVVETGMGQVRCEKLVIATNGYTHLLPGAAQAGLARQQRPLIIKGTITEPLTAPQWDATGWRRRCGLNIVSDLFYSFAPTADGRILHVGGYYAGSPTDGSLTPEVDWRLKLEGAEHVAAFFPRLAGLRTAQTWGGPISITSDWAPHVGQTADRRIAYAVGCWGHGMGLGTHNGLTLAEITLERATENTGLWFVRRPKPNWPPRRLTDLVSDRIIADRRRKSRRIGAKLRPPLRFR